MLSYIYLPFTLGLNIIKYVFICPKIIAKITVFTRLHALKGQDNFLMHFPVYIFEKKYIRSAKTFSEIDSFMLYPYIEVTDHAYSLRIQTNKTACNLQEG